MKAEPKVRANSIQAAAIAGILKEIRLNPDFYRRAFLNFDADRESRLRMLFFSVAICHQTHLLHSERHNLWGWDYLEHGFLQMLNDQSPLLDPSNINHSETADLAEVLAAYFSDEGKPESSTLDRLEERVELMKDAAGVLEEKYEGKVSFLLDISAGYLVRAGKGLYELLDEFEAFADPHRKKSTFFLKLVMESGLLDLVDPENLIPIMDYHMQRVLLRTGCVEVLDEKLRKQLLEREVLNTDEPVRSACIGVLKAVAAQSGHAVTKMNDFFWSIGRSCCNETTLCRERVCAKVPCTFALMARVGPHDHCIFEQICPGKKDDAYSQLWHPVVKTHFY